MKRQHKTPYLQQIFESIWYQSGILNNVAKLLLLPFSALFCLIANKKRKSQTATQEAFNIPVIVVGNISVGGTGKTPLVIKLIELLKTAGYQPCIITRGYKGKAKQWPLLVTEDVSASDAGDEAKLMAIRTEVPVVAGANRNADINYVLANTNCNIIVSDDGLQHYKMKRDLEIAVVDAQRGLGNGYCLPAGPLREKQNRLDECDFVILNVGTDLGQPSSTKQYSVKQSSMQLIGSKLINLNKQTSKKLSDFRSVQVITGIGNSQRFIDTLRSSGINIIAEKIFPDHHHFVSSDFKQDSEIPIVMTEKDAVKCFELGLSNCWYLPVNAQLEKSFEDVFLLKVKNFSFDN